MISTKSQAIDGQLAVGRSLSVGGEAVVQGGATVNHDLKVNGRIISRDIQGNNKGLFSSEDSLEAAYKKPLPGWYAYVENDNGTLLYVVENGAWTASNINSMLDYVDLADYKQSLLRVEEQFTEDIENLDDSITTEVSERQAAVLQEQQQRIQADNDLNEAIGNEATARENADTELDGKISAEATARENAIAEEATARENAIEAEQNARIAADNTERGERIADVLQLQVSITSEEEDRKSDVRNINDALTDLGKSVWPLEVALGTSFDLAEYTGQPVTLEITRKVKRRGSLVNADDIESVLVSLTNNGTTEECDSATLPDKTFPMNINAYGLFKVRVEAAACDMEKTVEKEIRLELPMYFGFSNEANIAELNITSLLKQSLKTSPNGTYTLSNPTSGTHLWLCIPTRMAISKVTSSGFDVPMLAAVTKNPGLGEYKCYRTASESGINQGTIKITIS